MYRPKPGVVYNWDVRCADGALQVIQSGEYQRWLAACRGRPYSIGFVGGTSAFVHPGHPLWEALRGVAVLCVVGVIPPSLQRYMRWTGVAGDPRQFNCIKISAVL